MQMTDDSCNDLFWSGCLISSFERILVMILVTQIGANWATQVKDERGLVDQGRAGPRRPEAIGVTM